MRKCPKCAQRLSPLYFKTACKYCGADILYYHFDERLELDSFLRSYQNLVKVLEII